MITSRDEARCKGNPHNDFLVSQAKLTPSERERDDRDPIYIESAKIQI